jgi:hypothetical protein
MATSPGYPTFQKRRCNMARGFKASLFITLTMVLLVGTAYGNGYQVTEKLWIRAVIHTVEKGPVEAVWEKGGEDTTSGGHKVIWGYYYASPDDVSWGSRENPDLFVKIWFDADGRIDVNYFHVSVPDIDVYSEYNGMLLEGSTTMGRRYVRLYYYQNDGYIDESYEDGIPAAGYSPSHNPPAYSAINNLVVSAVINTVDGPIDAVWKKGGDAMTVGGHQVLWGHFYADPSDVNWGSENNPDLFVKVWFDASGRIDVNFFHVSVPDIEVYSGYPGNGSYDEKGTTIMADRYIRHEYFSPSSSEYRLTVSDKGTGSGLVRANDIDDIWCGDNCSEDYVEGTQVRLYAIPDEGSSFAGWSGGGCSGTGDCVVTMTDNITVEAVFSIAKCPGDTVGNVSMPDQSDGVFVSGGYAYVLTDDYLRTVDVSDHNNPLVISSFELSDSSQSIYVSGSYAYVGTYDKKFHVINVSNPAAPFTVASVELPDDAEDIHVSGNYAYISAQREGLQVVDISNPNAPYIAGSVDVQEYGKGIFVSGSYCYIADRGSGLQIINIENRESPEIDTKIGVMESVQDVFVSGSYAYVVGSSGTLEIYDISSPQNPVKLGSIKTDSWVSYNVQFYNNHVYMTDAYLSNDGRSIAELNIKVIDVRNPNNPEIVDVIDTPDMVTGIYISESYLYVSDYSHGLYIVDISGCN